MVHNVGLDLKTADCSLSEGMIQYSQISCRQGYHKCCEAWCKPNLLDYYQRHMTDGTFVSWLAFDGEKIVGTSGMSFVEKPPYFGCPSGKIVLLSSMYTHYGFVKNEKFMSFKLQKVMYGQRN